MKKTILLKFQSKITCFVWGKKSHRCSKDVLCWLKGQVGLGLPNLWWYYQEAQLAQISIMYSRVPKPAWVSMERQAVPSHKIDFLLWSPTKLTPPVLAPILSHSLALCDILHKHPSLVSNTRPLSHLFHNLSFPPSMNIKAFQWWLSKGLFRIGHFFNSMGPISLGYCISKLEMPIAEKIQTLSNFYISTHYLAQQT